LRELGELSGQGCQRGNKIPAPCAGSVEIATTQLVQAWKIGGREEYEDGGEITKWFIPSEGIRGHKDEEGRTLHLIWSVD